MSDFTLVSSETKPLTKEVATSFKLMKASPTERDLNPGRVKHLRGKIDAGLAIPFNWSCADINGELVRMNGQHSSTVLSEMNGSFPEGLQVHMDTYKVVDHEGLALLFRQFDDRKSSRSASDVSGAYQGLYPELNGIAKDAAKLAAEAINWYLRVIEEMPSQSGDDIYVIFRSTGYYSS